MKRSAVAVGRCRSSGWFDRASAHEFEPLEPRRLLGGDHPSFGDFPNATEISVSSTRAEFSLFRDFGVLETPTDNDLFSFEATSSGRIDVSVGQHEIRGGDVAPQLHLYDSSLNLIGVGQSFRGMSACWHQSAVEGQRFYIRASVGTPDGTYTTTLTGAYWVIVVQIAENTGLRSGGTANVVGAGAGPQTGQEVIPGTLPSAGEFLGATEIPLDIRNGDGMANGNLSEGSTRRLYRYTVPANGPVQVQVRTPITGLRLDAAIRIFDHNRNQIVANQSGYYGVTAAAGYSAVAGSTFYAEVLAMNGTTGLYELEVNSTPATNYLYYPEGYSHAQIEEYIPLVNPNPFPVNYQIFARYEVGERDQLISVGTLEPNSRGGITVHSARNPNGSLVRLNEPYALEIQSSAPLSATLSHYDFGATIGEQFTDRLSTTWSFPEVRKNSATVRDFLVYFNPNDEDAYLTVTVIGPGGSTQSLNQTVAAHRRAGINIDLSGSFATGTSAVRIISTRPIVAAQSSYETTTGRGFGILGDRDRQARNGVLTVTGDTDLPGAPFRIPIANFGIGQAQVSIVSTYLDTGEQVSRTIFVNAVSRSVLTPAALGVASGRPIGIKYVSSVPISLSVVEHAAGDADATIGLNAAGTTLLVGDAFVNPFAAGTTYRERLTLFNPNQEAVVARLLLQLTDGEVLEDSVVIQGRQFASLRIDQHPSIRNRTAPTAFSIRIEAPKPVSAHFVHYDLFLNGGWGTAATPMGLVVGIDGSII